MLWGSGLGARHCTDPAVLLMARTTMHGRGRNCTGTDLADACSDHASTHGPARTAFKPLAALHVEGTVEGTHGGGHMPVLVVQAVAHVMSSRWQPMACLCWILQGMQCRWITKVDLPSWCFFAIQRRCVPAGSNLSVPLCRWSGWGCRSLAQGGGTTRRDCVHVTASAPRHYHEPASTQNTACHSTYRLCLMSLLGSQAHYNLKHTR